MAFAGIDDDQRLAQRLEVRYQLPHLLAAGTMGDSQGATQQRREVVLTTRWQLHQLRFEIARQRARFHRASVRPAVDPVDRRNQRHGERRTRSQTASPRRVAVDDDLHRRRFKNVKNRSDQRSFALAGQFHSRRGPNRLIPLQDTETLVAPLQLHSHRAIDRHVDRHRLGLQQAERPDIQRSTGEIHPAPRPSFHLGRQISAIHCLPPGSGRIRRWRRPVRPTPLPERSHPEPPVGRAPNRDG